MMVLQGRFLFILYCLTRSLRDFFRRFLINTVEKYNAFPTKIASVHISPDNFRPISGSETKNI